MSQHDSPTIRRFVRTAWIMLAFQLVFAIGAVAVAIWAASAVRQAVDQRDLLQARVAELEARPAPAAPAPVEDVTPAPAPAPAPVNEVAPAPAPTPVPPVVRTAPPVRQPPVRNPPPYRPPVYTPPPPVYTPPPVYQPPVYVPPPQVDDKPPVTRDDPPPRRPRRPRPQINIDIPGLFGGPSRDRPSRTPNTQTPPRAPGTTLPNPNNRNPARPPSTSVPTTPNSTTVIRRRPRPTANDPQPPPIR